MFETLVNHYCVFVRRDELMFNSMGFLHLLDCMFLTLGLYMSCSFGQVCIWNPLLHFEFIENTTFNCVEKTV